MRVYAFALDLALTLAIMLPPFGAPAAADDGAVSASPQTQAALPEAAAPPPPKSNPEPSAPMLAPPQPITLRIAAAPAPPKPPAAPQSSQSITLHLVSQPQAAADTAPAPAPAPIPVTLTVAPQQPAPAAAVVPASPATVAAQVHYPGPMRRAIGSLGEALARQKMARIFVPLADAQVQPSSAAMVRVAPLAIRQPDPAPVVQYVEAQPVLASPQSPSGFCKNLFRRR